MSSEAVFIPRFFFNCFFGKLGFFFLYVTTKFFVFLNFSAAIGLSGLTTILDLFGMAISPRYVSKKNKLENPLE